MFGLLTVWIASACCGGETLIMMAVTVKNGHGTQLGFPVPTLDKLEETQAFIDARVAEGSDYIKIIYDHFETIGSPRPTLTKEMLRAAIEAAHARNKLAVSRSGTGGGWIAS